MNTTQLSKGWKNAICSHMDGLGDHRTDWSQAEKDKYQVISSIYGILENDTNEFIHKTGRDPRHRKQTDTNGERRGGIN